MAWWVLTAPRYARPRAAPSGRSRADPREKYGRALRVAADAAAPAAADTGGTQRSPKALTEMQAEIRARKRMMLV
jgi:hypothetical protein